MEGKPDLIIGNYTDGNLVASLMASKLGITQVLYHHHLCSYRVYIFIFTNLSIENQGSIAHALEKTKYENSDVKWKELDPQYHFSCQFIADIIAMNASDFIISSTYQEIAGRLDNYPTMMHIFNIINSCFQI